MTTRRGFTLLEAIVALAIVSIVAVGVLAAEGTALRTEALANARLPLAMLARERLAAVDVYAGPLERLPDAVAVGTFPAPFERARWVTRTQRVPGTHGLWDVATTVWQDNDSLTLATRRVRADSGGTR